MTNIAKLKPRFLALLIDLLAIITWGIILFAINMCIYYRVLDGIPKFDEIGMNFISLTIIIPTVIYSIIMESGKKHATIGKQKMKINVRVINNKMNILWYITVRNIIKFLPWQLAHMMIFRGFALNWELSFFWMSMLIIVNILPIIWVAVIVIRKDHRGVHDLIAKTIVVDLFQTNYSKDM